MASSSVPPVNCRPRRRGLRPAARTGALLGLAGLLSLGALNAPATAHDGLSAALVTRGPAVSAPGSPLPVAALPGVTPLSADALLSTAPAITPATTLPAEQPLDLPSRITDPAGVLGDQTGEVEAAMDRLEADTPYQLFVVYVDTFDGQDAQTWAVATANLSGLGRDDVLLAVATQDRRYDLSADHNIALSDAALDRVQAAVEDQLAQDEWAGAAVAAADTLRAEATGSTGVSGWLVALVVGLLVIAGFFVVRAMQSRRRGTLAKPGGPDEADELAQLPTDELSRRAGSALVAIDDAVKTSEQELGFAQAQFGLEATQEFQVALENGKKKVTQAFALRQQLDDDAPEAEPQARAMMAQIITLCGEVARSLDAESDHFDELRDLQSRAPELLDDVERRAGEVEARVEPARSTLATLAATYPEVALASVAANPDQALQLVAGAREAVAAGRAALEGKDRTSAVAHARAAENAVGQAVTLLDAVGSAGEVLAQAGQRLDVAIASITADIADAARLAPADPAVGARTSEAQAAVFDGEAARTGGDPIAALRRLTDAEAALDAALAPFREKAEQAARAAALLRDTLGRVDSQVRATNDYIETRRGAVGPEARTRLSEAIRLLGEARALQASDPVRALATAQQADSLAQSAAQLAQRDASAWESQQGGPGMFGGGSGGGSNVGGMVLGGILLDQILRGGGGGGHRSGGGFGGGFGGGGFGGGRSSGGRSGGGRSSRGGRF
ncbi:TPM domain-containing protein [Oerskovia turbata]